MADNNDVIVKTTPAIGSQQPSDGENVKTTVISTIAVQSGKARLVIAILQVSDVN